MHRANVAIFLTAVGLIGIAPMVLGIVYLARRRADGRSSEDAERSDRSTVVAVVGIMAIVLIAGGSAAWVLAARGLVTSPTAMQQEGMVGMAGMAGPDGTTGMNADGVMRMSLPALERLGGLPLTSSITGAQAVDQVMALHGAGFAVRDAVIATYANGRATIWVSLAPDRRTAVDQVSTMVTTIDASGSPFARPSPVPGLRGVYVTSGMGQRHFLFARGETVWWVAADPSVASDVLKDVLEVAT